MSRGTRVQHTMMFLRELLYILRCLFVSIVDILNKTHSLRLLRKSTVLEHCFVVLPTLCQSYYSSQHRCTIIELVRFGSVFIIAAHVPQRSGGTSSNSGYVICGVRSQQTRHQRQKSRSHYVSSRWRSIIRTVVAPTKVQE